MNIRKTLILLLTLLSLGGSASAQSDQELLQALQESANLVRSNYAKSEAMLGIAQMANDSQQYQLAQYELQYNQEFYNYLESLAHNLQTLRDPNGRQQYMSKYIEYSYRTSQQDYRPYQQITGNMQQWYAQRQWETSTPEGQQAYQNQRQQAHNNFNAHQNRMQQANQNFDNYMTGLRNDSAQRDKYQQQYVNTIHDRYQYVNPYDGQNYMYSNNHSGTPVMQNPDGSYTQLVPYQNY